MEDNGAVRDKHSAGRPDDDMQDGDIQATHKLFYRLKDRSGVHHFEYTDEGIKCPFCSKIMKNAMIHFKQKDSCAEKIDMDFFKNMYETIRKVNRKEQNKKFKQKERKMKREMSEGSFKEKERKEKEKGRKKKNDNTDDIARLRNFNRAVIFGPIFICSCYLYLNFQNKTFISIID